MTYYCIRQIKRTTPQGVVSENFFDTELRGRNPQEKFHHFTTKQHFFIKKVVCGNL